MSIEEIITQCEASVAENGFIVFSDETLATMSADDVARLQQHFEPHVLMLLPAHEIGFFEWLKVHDEAVWKDLWEDQPQAPYLVSLVFLDDFTGSKAGGIFPICDLQTQDNYFFSPLMFHEQASSAYVAAVRVRFTEHQTLSPAQALALEASFGPIDIWHFSYLRRVDLATAKKAVATLVDDGILVHVPKAEHLTEFFDVR